MQVLDNLSSLQFQLRHLNESQDNFCHGEIGKIFQTYSSLSEAQNNFPKKVLYCTNLDSPGMSYAPEKKRRLIEQCKVLTSLRSIVIHK